MRKAGVILAIVALIGLAACAAAPTRQDNIKGNAEKSFDNLETERARTVK